MNRGHIYTQWAHTYLVGHGYATAEVMGGFTEDADDNQPLYIFFFDEAASLYLYTKSISHLNSILVFYFLFYYYYCSYLIKILIFNFKFKNNCNIDATKLLLHLLPTKHYVNLSLFSPPFFSIQTQCKSLPFLLLPLSSIKIDPLPSLFFNQTELNCVFSIQF